MATDFDLEGNRFLAALKAVGTLFPAHFDLVTLPAEQILLEPGERVRDLYFPTAGLLSAQAVAADGAEIEAVTVGREGIAGLPWFGSITSPFRWSVTVESQALKIPYAHWAPLVSGNEAWQVHFDEYRRSFGARIVRTLLCNSVHTLRRRCCRWLAAAVRRTGSDTFSLTHDRFAALQGVRRPSITEVLMTLAAEGLVETVRGRINVQNLAGLETGACVCLAEDAADWAALDT